MTRAVRLTLSPQRDISIGDVLTIGLVCVAGDDVGRSNVDWRSESKPTQHSVNWRSESRTPHQASNESQWRQPRDKAARRQFSMSAIRANSKSVQGCWRRSVINPESKPFEDPVASVSSSPIYNWRNPSRSNPMLDDPGSRVWLLKSESGACAVPTFFQITRDTSPFSVFDTVRRSFLDVSGKYQSLCAELFNAVEARFRAAANLTEQGRRHDASEGKKKFAEHPNWDKLLPAVKAAIKRIVHSDCEMADQSAAASWNVSRRCGLKSKEDRVRALTRALSEEEHKVLCFLEPTLTWLTLTADEYHSEHSMPETMVAGCQIEVRTALLRHHLLMRLSSIEDMTDNRAATYIATLARTCLSREEFKLGAPKCLHSFVRLSSRQEIAKELLKALDTHERAMCLNFCFMIAVDILGHGHSECPASWQDIVPFFREDMSYEKYTDAREVIASRLRPWLKRLAGLDDIEILETPGSDQDHY
eukprot:Blabericola_migrator_1__5319@NODE_2729_length_2416_cov_99_066411_g1709_i0_p1_GENE_NODE_2729_length_2416_cov_99_066411_g1709_i0NODE_2729_length_2416_cov_99_066411_g1709_i0_p1_ORF_typecomplete_len475_score53_32Glucosaminidase/PF01832_20/0_16Glucosaminidase/PF01832_20/1_8e03_NODE_2729_length_2416_cov_99_066411_g1709_i08862310